MLSETVPGTADYAEILAHVERVFSSPPFASSPRLQHFLKFVIEKKLSGNADELKESVIAVEIFGRSPSFDSSQDSVVRNAAWRLRQKLEEYYASSGSAERLRIEIPRGGYEPLFHWTSQDRFMPAATPGVKWPWRWIGAFSAVIAAAAACLFIEMPRGAVRGRAPSAAVLDLYYEGRHAGETNWGQAVALLRQATQVDPNFTPAQAALAEAYATLAQRDAAPTSPQLLLAERVAKSALAIDPHAADAHRALGFVRYCQQRWPDADAEFRRAADLNPSDAKTWREWSLVDFAYGRFADSERKLQRAATLNPSSAWAGNILAQIYYYWRRYDTAIRYSRRLLAVEPDNFVAHMVLANSLVQTGNPREALKSWREMERYLPGAQSVAERTAQYEALCGNPKPLRALLAEAEKSGHFVSPWIRAGYDMELGERKAALSDLANAAKQRDADLISVRWDPLFDPIRGEPEYRDIVEQLGFH